MNTRIVRELSRLGFIGRAALALTLGTATVWANPQGLTVVSGSAHTQQQGSTLQITTSQTAFLQWNSFNIASGELTIFKQPSANSIVFNNIKDANPSTIFGSLEANGIVVLENQSGFYFGPNAFVKAAGLVVTTAAINPWASGGGAGWSFDGPPATAPIVNYGHLEVASGGSLFVIGKQIDNQGTIDAPGGTAALVAGEEVLLSSDPNGLSLSVPVKLPAGSVDNEGRITADAGQVLLQAQTVNNSGVIQANSVRNNNGVIELYASDDVQLSGSSVIQADGGPDGVSPGGNIVIKSGGTFTDSAGSQISATGGANGGTGGNVEVSAPEVMSLNSSVDESAQPGWGEGMFSLDPQNIELGNFSSGSTSAGTSGTITASGGTGTLDVDVGTAFQNINANITLQAAANITLDQSVNWNLSATTGKTSGNLYLEAGNSITLDSSSAIQDPNNWSITLDAGYSAGKIVTGSANNVSLLSGAYIRTATGNISVNAGNNVTVGPGGIVTGIANGSVISGPGGNISVQAGGNVNTGTSSAGYSFNNDPTGHGYVVDSGLGGISTANGGNVTIQANGNITSTMPTSQGTGEDAGAGAFGLLPGNVTLTARGNITGHYVVADGTGTITAGKDAGTANNNLALSLVKGGWMVNAASDIYLQEVRNPNGMFNATPAPNPFLFRFDYDPLSYVDLVAGNGVTITGANLPRLPGANPTEGLIFPPNLTIDAGAGGITLDVGLSLFPSPEGSLVMTTTGGGSLQSASSGAAVDIAVSDSQSAQWLGSGTYTSQDPGNDVLHWNDPNPVLFNISGSISDINLYSPKPVDLIAAGDIIDSSASIQNLHPSDTSLISAGGELIDYASYVILPLAGGATPNFNALDQVSVPLLNALTLIPDLNVPGGTTPLYDIGNPNFVGALENIEQKFKYDPGSHSVEFKGVMNPQQEAALLAMTTPFLPSAVIEQIYTQSQKESVNPIPGYFIAGPGALRINAGSVDLGNGGGVVSLGIDGYPGVVPYTSRGAELDITTTGDLSMVASRIESEYGGNINITVGGTVDVGSPLILSASEQHPLGIVSLWSGNINVIANGDVNVDGSRIAAYDGGNIFVESLQGDVNAGTGGAGSVPINKPYVDPQGFPADLSEDIPGSGILATSFPQAVFGQTSFQLGNITVETPRGNIEATSGGIVQLTLSPIANNNATINVVAGSPGFIGNVNASGSGVVGGQVNISATGNINGLVVASLGADVQAGQNVSATVLSQGAAVVSAGQSVSGTVVGVGSVSVSGGSSDTALALSNVSVSQGGVAATGAGAPTGPTGSSSASAAATQQQNTEATQSNADLASNNSSDDDDLKKKGKTHELKEYIGRVRVILPE